MDRLRIGILFGGMSEEHPVSVKSAREVVRHLDRERYEPVLVGITADGAWRLCRDLDPGWEDAPSRAVVLAPDREVHGLLVREPGHVATIRLDAVVPVLHGRLGEDGAVQGLLELAGIPYVGCDVAASALCMDKSLAYVVAAAAGIATPAYRVLAAGEDLDPAGLAYPVFVKPARSGSSFGVSRVDGPGELSAAVATARRYDAKVLVEQAVAGSELGCALLGDGDDLLAGEVDQVGLSHGFFRIHQEDDPERGSDNATVVVPAAVPAATRRRVQEAARRVYRALGCRGLARVDLFLTDEGEIVLNEVNTFPGMTTYSRYPRMMAAAGLSPADVLDRAIAAALEGRDR
ncbi:D-alanine--D-alanine ligase family protein [Nocardioides sp. R1-1]|uniref:D-alanine--D-alanine ligase family protein n=1 Tax=Nocardioides sp. R1-1 TaxID=3383502 RepID=UPI0038D1F055